MIVASVGDDTVSWFENLTPFPDCNGNGINDIVEINAGLEEDSN